MRTLVAAVVMLACAGSAVRSPVYSQRLIRLTISTAITIDTISIRPQLTDTLGNARHVPENKLAGVGKRGSCGIRMLRNGPADGPIG
jgi:hypothetical protein